VLGVDPTPFELLKTTKSLVERIGLSSGIVYNIYNIDVYIYYCIAKILLNIIDYIYTK
jgi:hypothetical protein